PWGDLPRSVRDTILRGADIGKREAGKRTSEVEWEGVLRNIERRYDESESDTIRLELQEFMIEVPCNECSGRRLKPEALSVTVHGKSIGDVVEYAVTEALEFFQNIPIRQDGKP